MFAVKITDLTKRYAKGEEALKGIDLTVLAGDFFALLGSNGAGKSTTIGILSSLINKSSGSIEVFGYDLKKEPELAKSCIGLVPQEFNFNQFEPVDEILINQAGFTAYLEMRQKSELNTILKSLAFGISVKRKHVSFPGV